MNMLKKALALALAALLLIGLSLPAAVAELTVEEVQKAFEFAAFGSEYGAQVNKIRRWAKPIVIQVVGDATEEDLATINKFIDQLNLRVNGLPKVSLATAKQKANLTIYFDKLDNLPSLLESYVPGNWGYFAYWNDSGNRMTKAVVLISTDVTDQAARNHLLMEEIVGLLGLANDIDTHEDSIIYQPWTTTQQLSELDWELLDLLYDSRLKPGMTVKQARKALDWD